jgi:hypothetical protein
MHHSRAVAGLRANQNSTTIIIAQSNYTENSNPIAGALDMDMGFNSTDIVERSAPVEHDFGQLVGLLKKQPAKNALGFLLIIGDQLNREAPVCIEFAALSNLSATLSLVQYGSPYHLAVLAFVPTTYGEVEEIRASLSHWKCRTDDTNWFHRSDCINAYIAQLQEQMRSARSELDEEPIARKSPKSPAMKRDAIRQKRMQKRGRNRHRR